MLEEEFHQPPPEPPEPAPPHILEEVPEEVQYAEVHEEAREEVHIDRDELPAVQVRGDMDYGVHEENQAKNEKLQQEMNRVEMALETANIPEVRAVYDPGGF